MCKVSNEIYFPEIEVYDGNWLKYALLYKEGLTTMSPEYRDEFLSDRHREIQRRLDFFEYYHDFEHCRNVNNAIRGLLLDEEIMKSPMHNANNQASKAKFKYETLHDCFSRKEKNVELFSEKMTDSLSSDLVDLGYGFRDSQGRMFVSRDFVTLYMGMMAESIGQKNNLRVSSTNASYQLFQNMLKVMKGYGYEGNVIIQEQIFEKIIIDQSLPKNIDDISFESIIRLRSRREYENALLKYNKLLTLIKENLNDYEVNEDILNEITSKRSTMNALIQSEFGVEIFSNMATLLISRTTGVDNFATDIISSFLINKSIPHVRTHLNRSLKLPELTITTEQIKSVKYLKSSWENLI